MPRINHPASASHNHIGAMIALLRCLSITPMESEATISFYVIHRDWCHIRKGEFCNCDPTVSLVAPGFHRIRDLMLQRAKELKGMSL